MVPGLEVKGQNDKGGVNQTNGNVSHTLLRWKGEVSMRVWPQNDLRWPVDRHGSALSFSESGGDNPLTLE